MKAGRSFADHSDERRVTAGQSDEGWVVSLLCRAMKGGSAGTRRSGVPSTRASDAAERSQAVYFANLQADMLLQKQMHVLKRAENSLVHRIAIDQKILFRRFQVSETVKDPVRAEMISAGDWMN